MTTRTPNAPNRTNDPAGAGRAAILFVLAAVAFVVGGLLAVVAGPPPSEAPVAGMTQHALWAVAVTLAALGTLLLVRSKPALRERTSALSALATLGLGVVAGLQWVTWAYVDLRASAHEGYEAALATVITPFGAGHSLMYAILVGAGFALLGRALAKSGSAPAALATAGVVIGGATVVMAAISFFFGLGGGGDGVWLFDVATLLIPIGYLWAAGTVVVAARRG